VKGFGSSPAYRVKDQVDQALLGADEWRLGLHDREEHIYSVYATGRADLQRISSEEFAQGASTTWANSMLIVTLRR